MRSPVLFLVFNRPQTTRQVFAAIRAARPAKLYVAADGPRAGRTAEAKLCEEVRATVAAVDWPCEVKTLFQEQNLGCKHGVAAGITWFFEHEPEGIILEDDVLPIPTFFQYCDEMLERYRDDLRIAMVGGCNLASTRTHGGDSYFFSYYCNIWGWASWRRVWRHYDAAMSQWPAWRDGGGLAKISGGRPFFAAYWRRTMDAVHGGMIDTWDYQWTFACWLLGGLTILPAVSQVTNLGFGADATHTTMDAPNYVLASGAESLHFPLVHPARVERDLQADASIGSRVFGINWLTAVRRLLTAPGLKSMFESLKILIKQSAH
jgi:hypothetical protein